MPKGGRGTTIEGCYRLVRALLEGKTLDRRSAARLLNTREAAADAHLNAIAEIVPGVVETKVKHQRTLQLNLDAAVAPPSRSLAAAACLGGSLAHLFRGSSYETLLAQTLDHIVGRAKKQVDFKEARRKFIFVTRGGEIALPERQGIFDDLVEAVLVQKHVELTYSNFDGERKKKIVAPWSIAIYDHQIYLLGSVEAAGLAAFRLSRIHSARTLSNRFDYPPRATFDPDVVFSHTFGIFVRGDDPIEDVVIRLDKRWSTYARTHRWHTSQVVRDEADGIYLKLHVRSCPELETFVLGFGDDAEVLGPARLRDRIAERVRIAADRYTRETRNEQVG